MFCIDPIHPLYTAILDIVATSPHIRIADLHTTLRRRKVQVTLQHVYRTVNRLVEAQILLKTGTRLSVNLMWLSYLQFFADSGKTSLLAKGGEQNIFPLKEGEQRTYTVDSLQDLQTLWNHLLVQLHKAAPQKFLLKYYSHAWWQLGEHALDPAFYSHVKKAGIRCYWLLGNRTFLDQYAAKLHNNLMDVRLAESPPFPKEGYNLNVYGPYIFECLFPDRIEKHLEFTFHAVTSEDLFNADVYSDIFHMKVPLTLKIRRDEARALELRKKIERYFLKT